TIDERAGAGKTTMIILFMRFNEVNGVTIKMNNKDIESMSLHDIRAHFGMVLQETWLLNGTIRDNIAYGKTYAAETEVIQAAKAAEADQFIRMLPDGYDAILNEDASNISQGQ